MSATTLSVTVDMPDLGEESWWGSFEALLVAMGAELPARMVATALAEAQGELVDRVCGLRWLPVRDLPAPFACSHCGVSRDFARKGQRSRPRKFHTAVGTVAS